MNLIGVRVSSGIQLVFSAVLVAVIAVAVIVTVPSRITHHWTPFAPHGWWAVGTAANILIWLFVGWEAMAQMAGDFKNPGRDLPRAVAVAYAVIAVLYSGLAVATIVTAASGRSRVPLADLMGLGFGRAGRDVTVLLAITLTVGTVNVYIGSASKLAASLAATQTLPRWLADPTNRSIPRRPLAAFAMIDVGLFVAVQLKLVSADDLVRATSACFIAVYLLALGSGVRILTGAGRMAAVAALALICVVAVFSAAFLLLPAGAALVAIAVHSRRRARPQLSQP
jgi:amino acid efflux transporter